MTSALDSRPNLFLIVRKRLAISPCRTTFMCIGSSSIRFHRLLEGF